jgi:ANTAR domain-containing protein/GAF domain-containing protein
MVEELLAHEQPEPVLHDVVNRARTLVSGAHHVSVMAHDGRGNGFASLAASDDLAGRCDALMADLDEGPGVLDHDPEPVHRSGDLAADGRWPLWSAAAHDLGIRSVLSIRLVGQGKHLGSLNLYSENAFAFGDDDDIELAVLFAGHAAAALGAVTEISGLRAALESRHVIGVAQGILMERYDLTVNGAFEVLKRFSSVHNLKLRDVANALVETGVMPGEADEPPLPESTA